MDTALEFTRWYGTEGHDSFQYANASPEILFHASFQADIEQGIYQSLRGGLVCDIKVEFDHAGDEHEELSEIPIFPARNSLPLRTRSLFPSRSLYCVEFRLEPPGQQWKHCIREARQISSLVCQILQSSEL